MAAKLARRSDRFLFLIVGDGELRHELEAETARLGLDARTRFLGWRGDLETIYGATDVFVLTSRNEGTPVALIEAMAAEVASASTNVGGVSDVLMNRGLGARRGRRLPRRRPSETRRGGPGRKNFGSSAVPRQQTPRGHESVVLAAFGDRRYHLWTVQDLTLWHC
jgi:hypothetical protein